MGIVNFINEGEETAVVFKIENTQPPQLNREIEVCRPVKNYGAGKYYKISGVPVLAQAFANKCVSEEAEMVLENAVQAFYRATGTLPKAILTLTNKSFLELWMYVNQSLKHYKYILSSDETDSGKSVMKITLWEDGYSVMIVAYDYSDNSVLHDPDKKFADRVNNFLGRRMR